MHVSFLDDLVCPESRAPLQVLDVQERDGDFIVSGTLGAAGREYPIVRGIPRFVPSDGYCGSFGYQWNKWRRIQFESENAGGPMEGHTQRMFERISGQEPGTLSGQVVLDVGCGPGRFIDVVRRQGGRAIGVDYSLAVEAAAENFPRDKDVLICQADAACLPLRAQSMDGVYSIGVLHHTPSPEGGFREMVRAAKPGGWVAVSVYGKGGYYDSPRVVAWRSVFKLLKPLLGVYPPLGYSYAAAYAVYPFTPIPGIGHLLRLLFPMTRLPDVRWRILDTFDSLTPTYQSAHESYEVYSWLRNAGLTGIAPSNWGFTSYHGTVPA